MNVPRQDFERDLVFVLGNIPQVVGALIHDNGVGIDIPCPQGDAGGARGGAKVLFLPYRHRGLFRRHPSSAPSCRFKSKAGYLAARQVNSTTAAPSAAA